MPDIRVFTLALSVVALAVSLVALWWLRRSYLTARRLTSGGGMFNEQFEDAVGALSGGWVEVPDWPVGKTLYGSMLAEPPPAQPTITILADDQTQLLTLRVEGGRLTAEYDPARLDDAARALVERMLRLYGVADDD